MPLDMAHTSVDVHPSTKTAAFFDVDNTLLPGSASEVRFFWYLWRAGVVGWKEAIASLWHLLKHVPPLSYHPLRLRKVYLEGKMPRGVEALADSFCREHLIPTLSSQGLRQMDEHRRAGHDLVLVTGSLDCLMRPLARFLDVETVIAAQPECGPHGYTGHLVPPLPYGDGKRVLIEAWATARGIDLPSSFAYGDSPGDVGLLEVVGHPMVVNPIRGMGHIAHRRCWPVTRWA